MQHQGATLREAEGQIAAGKVHEAAATLQSLCAAHPTDSASWFLLGACRHQIGELSAALLAFGRVLALDPGHYQAALAEIAVLCQTGQTDTALAQGQNWLHRHPADVQMLFSIGLVHEVMGDDVAALAHYDRALKINQSHPESLQNRGVVLIRLGRAGEAIENNRRFLAASPESPAAHRNLVESCLSARRHQDAVSAANNALAISPSDAQLRLNRGYALAALGRIDEARRDIEGAIENDDGALRNRFTRWAAQTGFTEPQDLASLMQAEDLFALAGYERIACCDWDGYEAFVARCTDLVGTSPSGVMQSRSLAFKLLNLPIPAASQKKLADRVAAGIVHNTNGLAGAAPMPGVSREKVRVGYLSSDFGPHPTSRLTAQIYGLHDRRRLEVFGYSLSKDDGSKAFENIRRACDTFADISDLPLQNIAQRIAADGIDILVDLNGYNRHGRSEVFALRPAPIQVGYAAYPATLGGNLLDYVIADHTVIPSGSEQLYAERVVRLPHCYAPNSLRRAGIAPPPSRLDAGLPASGFVFCALNRHEKFDPPVFALWMRILSRIPGSVLWLQAGPGEANLRRNASAAGVEPQRLIFAPMVETGAYLARLQLADLYLDTLHWTAHTQGMDALWAGVPIITRPGEHWVSRLAAGLLQAIGLEDCIVDGLETYEALACELAANPQKLRDLKARLARNRDTHPLFDIERLVQNLDAAYIEMWRIHTAGEAPRSFDVIEARP